MSDPKKLALLNDPEFKALAASKNRISLILTALTLVVYYGFIFLIAFHPGFFGRKITTNITIGIPIGIGVIVASWVLTGIYVRWANTRYDEGVRTIRAKLEGPDAGRP